MTAGTFVCGSNGTLVLRDATATSGGSASDCQFHATRFISGSAGMYLGYHTTAVIDQSEFDLLRPIENASAFSMTMTNSIVRQFDLTALLGLSTRFDG
jgi:hypothetical protein